VSAGRSAPLPDVPSAASTFREVNGVELHVVAAGDPDDPLVVLLHGFPEFWYGWRDQVARLVEAGYRVLVPDQRGYNRSDCPVGLDAYRLSELSGDVVALMHTEGRDSARVVGHDWGAMVGWTVALRHPDAVDRLAVCNVGHPTAFREVLWASPEQLRRSWYAYLFQLPRIPEWLSSRGDFAALVDAMRESAESGTFTDRDFERYRAAWRRDGALRGMIDWYRAATRRPERPPRTEVDPPTLIVWGENDEALVPALAPASLGYCRDGRLELFPDASHWVQHERPGRVGELLLEFLGEE